jgi:hypothetical protein
MNDCTEENPCPVIPITYPPGHQWWGRATYTEERYGVSHTVEAIESSLVSQADADALALAEAIRLVDRKFTHAIAPVGSRQLSKYKDKWTE